MKPLINHKEIYIRKDAWQNNPNGDSLCSPITILQKFENQYILSQQEMEELLDNCFEQGYKKSAELFLGVGESGEKQPTKEQFISNLLNK